jgi:hypothetical protein
MRAFVGRYFEQRRLFVGGDEVIDKARIGSLRLEISEQTANPFRAMSAI